MLCPRTGRSTHRKLLPTGQGCYHSPYAFESCEKLEQIGLPWTKAITDVRAATSPPEGLPTGCFYSAGIQMINISHSTEQLTAIDLSHTQVGIINVQVFSNCRSLTQAILPKHLTEIRAEAFEACISLCAAALPRQLHSIGHRAFAGCSKLVCLTYRGAEADRRRLQVAANAFEGCQALTVPGGICYGAFLRCSTFCRMLCSRTGGSAYSAPLQISLWCHNLTLCL